MTSDVSILQASTSADPWATYARLRATRAFAFDADAGLWVASTAHAVDAVLGHPALRVRPAAEPVPRVLQGTPAGEVFAQLVRMTDGAFHAAHKPAVAQAAQAWTAQRAFEAGQRAAAHLWSGGHVNSWASQVMVQAMARLLGTPESALAETVARVAAFNAGIAPGAMPQHIEAASSSAQWWTTQCEAQGVTGPRAANRLALMQQALDAGAGLIGNAVLRLQALPQSVDAAFIAEVARWDPPIHNTRRFAAQDIVLAGQSLREGDAVLVLLAGANRDPTLHADAESFRAGREQTRCFGFGAGAHACPGEAVALAIARAAVAYVAADASRLAAFSFARAWRPLPNARIPLFD